MNDIQLNAITEKIIGCAFDVARELGSGYLEKIYENAMYIAMNQAGLRVVQQFPITVTFRGSIIGDFAADFLVEDEVLVELKSAKAIADANKAQCINYLKAAKKRICLLINFGDKVEIKRFVN